MASGTTCVKSFRSPKESCPYMACTLQQRQYNEMPLRVEYSLTERGRALLPIYYEMIRWEVTYAPESFA